MRKGIVIGFLIGMFLLSFLFGLKKIYAGQAEMKANPMPYSIFLEDIEPNHSVKSIMQGWDDRYHEKQGCVSLLELEAMLENNMFEELPFQKTESAIAFYEKYIHTPFEGYQILVYKETAKKDILLGYILWIEKETGDVYRLDEESTKLLKTGVKGLNLPDEPEDVLLHEYDEKDERISECLDKVFDFLKTEEGLTNFKIKYDGVTSFLGRSYCCVSFIEEINDDMIHTLQRYYIDLETGDFYQESAHMITGTRMELYYRGNLGA